MPKSRSPHLVNTRIGVLSRHLGLASRPLCHENFQARSHKIFTGQCCLPCRSVVKSLALGPTSYSWEDTYLPIFVLLPSLPLSEERFHIFEPRYRLMIKHCLSQTGPTGERGEFGMCWPVNDGSYSSVGTLLRIQEHTMHADGRFDIKCIAVRRFRILDRGTVSELESSTNTMATYNCATTEWFEDSREDLELVQDFAGTRDNQSNVANEARSQLVKLHDVLLKVYRLPEAKGLLLRIHGSELYSDILSLLDASKSINITINAPVEDSQLSWWLLSRLVSLPPDVRATLIMSQSISRRLSEATQLLEDLFAAFSDHVSNNIELVC